MSRLARLDPRERVLVLGVLPLVLLVAGWYFVGRPLTEARTAIRAEIATLRQLTATAALTAGDARPAAPAPAPDRDPAATRLTRSAELFALPVQRIEPDGPLVRVTLGDARFEDLVQWIAALEADEALRLAAAEIARRPEPGIVSAQLTFEDMP